MDSGNSKYVELAVNTFTNRAVVIPVEKMGEYVGRAQQSAHVSSGSTGELYRSYYTYDAEILEHMKIRKTVRGYRGPYFLDRILFDIDKGANSDQGVLDQAKAFFEMLENDFCDGAAIQIWYSGRGYHLVIPDIFGFTPGNSLPHTVAATMKKHFPSADEVWDGPRLIRVGQTINTKTHLFKVPLSVFEFFNMTATEIMGLAKTPRPTNFEKHDEQQKHTELIVLPAEIMGGLSTTADIRSKSTATDNPTSIVTCMQKLYNTPSEPGSRHTSLLRLASAFRRQGVPQGGIVGLLQGWAPSLEPYEIKRVVDDVFNKGLRYGCQDTIMKAHCDPKCIFFKNKNYAIEVMDVKQMEKKLANFVRTDFKNTSFNLGDIYQLPAPFHFYPGEYITVIGDTGVGKTAWMQDIVTKLENMSTLYLSLEVHELLLYRRFVQIKYGMTKEEVMQYYTKHDNHLSDRLDHIQVITTAPNLESIKSLIAATEPKIVVIDVVDGISMPFARDENSKIGAIAVELKAIAQQLNTIIFGIHHISKGAASAVSVGAELGVHSGKGSSSIEQKSDKVLAIEGNRDEARRILHSPKARDESPLRVALEFNKQTFRWTQLHENTIST